MTDATQTPPAAPLAPVRTKPPAFDRAADAPPPTVVSRGETLVFSGHWTLAEADILDRICREIPAGSGSLTFDLGAIERMDTAGAWFVNRLRGRLSQAGAEIAFLGATPTRLDLLEAVEAQKPGYEPPVTVHTPPVARFGEAVVNVADESIRLLAFFGAFIEALGRLVARPRDLRFTSIMHHIDHAGLRAVPIVALISLLIGAILTQQGIFQLKLFGAEQFAVDLTGILILREVGILLTAIMVAGRSGSAMTAEIGSMKMREEIDALRVLGLDPLEVLLVPRVIALVIALPLLGVVSGAAGLVGAALTSWISAGVTPVAFVERLREAVDFTTISAGLFKAPAMALMIGLTACIEGLRVGGSAESLGKHVTDAVVKSIFLVIVIDAIFALFYTAIDW